MLSMSDLQRKYSEYMTFSYTPTSIDGVGMLRMMAKVEVQSNREEPARPTLQATCRIGIDGWHGCLPQSKAGTSLSAVT